MARLPRLERGTLGLEGRCSIHLSYRRATGIDARGSRAVKTLPISFQHRIESTSIRVGMSKTITRLTERN